jgi:hypothetical protein
VLDSTPVTHDRPVGSGYSVEAALRESDALLVREGVTWSGSPRTLWRVWPARRDDVTERTMMTEGASRIEVRNAGGGRVRLLISDGSVLLTVLEVEEVCRALLDQADHATGNTWAHATAPKTLSNPGGQG